MLSVLVAVTAAVITGWFALSSDEAPSPEQRAAQVFFDALNRGDLHAAAAATDDAADAQGALAANAAGLGPTAKISVTAIGLRNRSAASSEVAYRATWSFGGRGTWSYQGNVPVAKQGAGWIVTWAPSDLHPQLSAGLHLQLVRTFAPRADLLDSSGQPLFTKQDIVVVGIDPSQVTDLNSLAATLAATLRISAADIIASVKASPPNQFVPVITLRRHDYDQVRAAIHDLPGTVFHESTGLLVPATHFAQPLLGQIGDATQELVTASKGKIAAGDQTGLAGLQRAFNDQLTGTPGLSVQLAPDDGAAAKALTVGQISSPVAGKPVQLTLDRNIQSAAEAALANVTPQAAIVVTQPSTGKLLAVATSAATQDNIGLSGQYPPGSTFKIATYAAAFATTALTPMSVVDCPATIIVNGQTVRNENNFAKGRIPASSAFAFSCNTTAATLGLSLAPGALRNAAASLGLGQQWSLPVDSFSGSLPDPAGSPNELAADSYGQGKVLVSPLVMAEMAGAASTGRPVAPSIVVGQQATPGAALPTSTTAALNTLMRAVVTTPGATGRALASLPGPVEGKTGTAEFGGAPTANGQAPSHSWFAGSRGDLAFSVFIYGGENSDSTTGAVSVAKTLLSQIPL